MGVQLTLTDVVSEFLSNIAYNNNNVLIEAAMDKALDRTASTDNAMEVVLDMGTNKITNVGTGTQPTDAVTKSYVDSVAAVDQSSAAEASAVAAAASEAAAAVSETNAGTSETNAAASEAKAAQWAEEVEDTPVETGPNQYSALHWAAKAAASAGALEGVPSQTGHTGGQVLTTDGTVDDWDYPVPVGIICMWSGSIGSIPTNWALCDGTGGTPDLRDRFVVGAGTTYSVDDNSGALVTDGGGAHTHTAASNGAHTHTAQSGGSHTHSGGTTGSGGSHSHTVTVNNHTLTESQMPSHTHDVNILDTVVASSPNVLNASTATDNTPNTFTSNSTGGGASHNHTGSSGSAGSHTHSTPTVASGGAHTHSTDSQGAHTHSTDDPGTHTHTYTPPYWALAFIMRTA